MKNAGLIAADKLRGSLIQAVADLKTEIARKPLNDQNVQNAMSNINALYSQAKDLLQEPHLDEKIQDNIFKSIKETWRQCNTINNYTPENIISSKKPHEVFMKNIKEMGQLLELDILQRSNHKEPINILSLQKLLLDQNIDVKAKVAILNHKITVDGISQNISVKDFCYLCEIGNTSQNTTKNDILPLYQLIENNKDLKSALKITSSANDVLQALNEPKYDIQDGKAAYINTKLYLDGQKQILSYAIENNIGINAQYVTSYLSKTKDRAIAIEALKRNTIGIPELSKYIDTRDIIIGLVESGRESEIQGVIKDNIPVNVMNNIAEAEAKLQKALTTLKNSSPDSEEVETAAISINNLYNNIIRNLQNPKASFEAQQYMLAMLDNLNKTLNTLQNPNDLSLMNKLEMHSGGGITKLQNSIKELQKVLSSMHQENTIYSLDASIAATMLLSLTLNRDNAKQAKQMKRAILGLKLIDPKVPGYVTIADKINASGAKVNWYHGKEELPDSVAKVHSHNDGLLELPLYQFIISSNLYDENSVEEAIKGAMVGMSKLKSQIEDRDKLVIQYNDCINFGVQNGVELNFEDYDLALLDTKKFITVCNTHYFDGGVKNKKQSEDIAPVINAAAEIIKEGKDNLRANKVKSYLLKVMQDLQKNSKKESLLKPENFKLAIEKGVLNLDDIAKWFNNGILTKNLIEGKVAIPNAKEVIEERPLYEHLILHEINSDKQKSSHRIAEKLDQKFGAISVNSSFTMYRDFDVKAICNKIKTFGSSSYQGQALAKIIKHYINLDIKEGRKEGSVLNGLLIKESVPRDWDKWAELLGKMDGEDKEEKQKAKREDDEIIAQSSPKAETDVLKTIMSNISEDQFTKIAPTLKTDLILCMMQENIGVGKSEVHPLLAVPNDVANKIFESPHLPEQLSKVKVRIQDGKILDAKDKEDGINLLQYVSQHKSYKEIFKHLVNYESAFKIDRIDIPPKKIIGLIREGMQERKIQDILLYKIQNDKDVISTMCELLAAGKNDPDFKGTYRKIYQECQKQIQEKFNLTDIEKQQFSNLFGELTSNPRTVALFTKSKEFQEAKESLGIDKAKMLLAYFVTKDFDEATKDLTTMRHLNTGHKELSGSIIQRIYDKLVDTLLYFKGDKSKKFKHLQEKCNPDNPGFAVVDKEADKSCTDAVELETSLLEANIALDKAIGGGRGL